MQHDASIVDFCLPLNDVAIGSEADFDSVIVGLHRNLMDLLRKTLG